VLSDYLFDITFKDHTDISYEKAEVVTVGLFMWLYYIFPFTGM